MTLVYGVRHSFSIFFPPILDEFGWSRGSTALMLSLNLLVYGFTAPVAGSLADRWQPRKVLLIGATILGLATASCAFARELWHFYLLFGVLVPIGMACSGWPIFGPTMSNWFARKRGQAMGLSQIGGGFSFVYGMYAEFAISQLGWRYAYFVLAGTLVTILLPLYFFFFHYHPEYKGLKAYGATELTRAHDATPEVDKTKNHAPRDWTLRGAMGIHQLWLMMFSYFLYWGVGCYLVLGHQVKFAQDVGYSSTFAASVFALFGISLSVGQLTAGISDWIGREITVTLASILAIGALIALLSVQDSSQSWLLYLYAIGFGYGSGLYSPTMTAGMADIFHGRHFGAIHALLLTGMGIGGAIGPWLGGSIYDISGSYSSAFILCMVGFAIACVAVWIAAPRHAARLRARMEGMPL
jgi:MFS family permease